MQTADLISTILQYGLKYGPKVIATIASWFTGTPGMPTADQWAALIAQTNVTAKDDMLAVLATLGIDPASPKGVALLALAPA